jgi:hypothetical protein
MGVLYPGLENFIEDYIHSIKSQDDNDFDLLILNDNAEANLRELFPKSTIWIDITNPSSFGEIRMTGIHFAVTNGYDFLIFTDLDDYFSENRVRFTKQTLLKYDFAFTRLRVIDEEKRVLINDLLATFHINPLPQDYREIENFNFLGLSHTAANTKVLKDFYIPKEIEAVDWWIFSLILLRHGRGCLIEDAITYYRQFDNNFVGFGMLMNEERLKRGIQVKFIQYKNLVEFCKKNSFSRELNTYSQNLFEIEELKSRIQEPGFTQRYIEIINSNFQLIYKGWWSEILPLNEWRKYAK